ncbi:MAG: hypothetical protein E6303_00770 [Clostridium perfringens]|nr:hydrolase domain tail protein [Staphylococcus phage Quidividi]AXF38471.1 minor tail protein [Staphylococcus phage Twillingate]MDU7109339.1 hypothetical protein [Clostridium perfringens]
MAKVLRLYDSTDKLLATSEEVISNSASVRIDDLKPNTSYEEGSFKISWVINGSESSKIDVPEFKTLPTTNDNSDDSVSHTLTFNMLNFDDNNITISEEEPEDKSKIWFKPVEQ